MLQAISWKDFLSMVGFFTALYYGWWVKRYYAAGFRERSTLPGGKPVEGVLANPLAKAAITDDTPELAAIEARLTQELISVFIKARMADASEAEVMELLRWQLTADPYPKLIGTAFQGNIEALIVRDLEKYGSIHPDPEVLKGLWRKDG